MIGIVAKLKVKAGSEAALEAAAAELVACTRTEPGCIEYGLWRTERSDTYVFVERYENEEAVTAHVKSEHYRRIGRQLGSFLEGPPEVTKLFSL